MPFEEMTHWAKAREGRVIGDFGCGEALFTKAVSDRHTVHSFDHIAINESMVEGDMAYSSIEKSRSIVNTISGYSH